MPEDLDLGRFVVKPPRDPTHGVLAVNAAMVYAKEAKASFANPRQLATELAARLPKTPMWIRRKLRVRAFSTSG